MAGMRPRDDNRDPRARSRYRNDDDPDAMRGGSGGYASDDDDDDDDDDEDNDRPAPQMQKGGREDRGSRRSDYRDEPRQRRSREYENAPQTVITSDDLVKGLSDGIIAPILAEFRAMKAENAELRNELAKAMDAIDELGEQNEDIKKALADVPETQKLVKALVEKDEAESRQNPERRPAARPQTTSAEVLSKGITPPAPTSDTPADANIPTETGYAEANQLVEKAISHQERTGVAVPGLAEIGAVIDTNYLRVPHIEALRKGLESVGGDASAIPDADFIGGI